MRIIIDRFEGDKAVVELPNGNIISMPAILAEGAKEGDVILITVDKNSTKKMNKRIDKLMDDLWE